MIILRAQLHIQETQQIDEMTFHSFDILGNTSTMQHWPVSHTRTAQCVMAVRNFYRFLHICAYTSQVHRAQATRLNLVSESSHVQQNSTC